ncbi:hypothetical protein [Streptomyces sp. TLI_171]|uniref:hypothetical protein n=1 Tax=Streptomyces sp. TLI_171 TaxID=1938859 RepID=UPI000C180C50|nr:hypothetical protein [Streptomyces sp. TLI_171]RKE17710.1 hypothetical protein BX266_0974 [Streptomyces sp. TLI_171]
MPRYELTALDVLGEQYGRCTDSSPPDLARMAAFGDAHRAGYVLCRHDRGYLVFGRAAEGDWRIVCDATDEDSAHELLLWFDLTNHYTGPGTGDDDPDHPLAQLPAPGARGPLSRERAVQLVTEWVEARGADYPVDALAAERFACGWFVHAPVAVDESDPMAFLDLPVGRSVFLVSDLGRVKEATSSLPPHLVRGLFCAEEAFVRRRSAEETFMDGFAAEFGRLAVSDGAPGIASFTVVDEPPEDLLAARAAGLVDPIVQQLSLLGPPGWESFTAVFSCTVSAEVARLSFRAGGRTTEVRVPEQLAVLVRRQRHLAAQLPAGPWWRLVLTADLRPGAGAGVITGYDYGDEPLPENDLLRPEHYREDLLAYPRTAVPAWLTRHLAGAKQSPAERRPTERATPPPPRAASVVLDTKHAWKRLYADTREIAYGKESLALDAIDWLRYPVVHSVTRRFLGPSSHSTTYYFGVGTGLSGRGGLADVEFLTLGKQAPPAEWTALVGLLQDRVEPRLLARFVEQVADGEPVSVAGLRLDRDGLAANKRALSWRALEPVRVSGGSVFLYRSGEQQPVFQVPLSHPNAVLVPPLLAVLAPRLGGRPQGG